MGLIDKLTGYLSLQPNRLASLVKGEVTLVDSAGNEAGIDVQYDVNVDQTSLNGNYLIGKPAGATNEDFVTTYTSANTITFSVYPVGIVGFVDEDIEFVRQIATSGSVTATYSRDDTAMSIAGDVLTVTGASFAATDTFIVATNVPRTGDINMDLTSVSGNYLIGKAAGATNADFTTVDGGATNDIDFSNYPLGITGFTADDIEFVRQINTGGDVVATYSRDDATMVIIGDTLSITGAVFAGTDTYVVGTNVPRATTFPDLEFSTNYIGKLTGGNGDFDISRTAATQLTVDTFPTGVSAFVAGDIGLVREVTVGGVWVADYTPFNSTITMAGAVITVAEAAFTAGSTFLVYTTVARPGGSSAGSAGGGATTYSNAFGDFVATINNGTKTITITALPFTLEAMHVVAGRSIKKIDTSDVVTDVALTDVAVAGGIITLADEVSNFVTGDVVVVTLGGPDKWYDSALDNALTNTQNPDYGHYTDVEHLVDEEDLGIDATALLSAAPTLVLEVTGAAYTPEDVAEGYTIYNDDDNANATVDVDSSGLEGSYVGDGGAGWDSQAGPAAADPTMISHSALSGANAWGAGEMACIPEVKRFEFSAESYPYLAVQTLLVAGDAINSVYVKIYGTLDSAADTTDDTGWINQSLEIFGNVDGIWADGIGDAAAAYQGDTYVIDQPSTFLKYMIKVVGEFTTAGQQFNYADVWIKKSY